MTEKINPRRRRPVSFKCAAFKINMKAFLRTFLRHLTKDTRMARNLRHLGIFENI